MDTKPLQVTFDTNVFRPLFEPEKQKPEQVDAFAKISTAIRDGRIRPFISDTIVVLEGIPNTGRAEYFSKLRPNIEIVTTPTILNSQAGFSMTATMGPPLEPIPIPDQLQQVLDLALVQGFFYIGVSRAGMPRLPEPHYKSESSSELTDRLERRSFAIDALNLIGVGSAVIDELAAKVIEEDARMEEKGMMAFASGNPRKVPTVVAEWADGDSVAAHYAHRHDIFCTFDEGKKAGPGSVLHSSRRAWLTSTLEIDIKSPLELAARL